MLALTVSNHLWGIKCRTCFDRFMSGEKQDVSWKLRPEGPLSWLAGGLEEMVLMACARTSDYINTGSDIMCEQHKLWSRIIKVLLWPLTQVLEACVKNCGHRFHVLVASQEFVEGVLVRSILPKYNPPAVLHDRVLSLIQVCSSSHGYNSTLQLIRVFLISAGCFLKQLISRVFKIPREDMFTHHVVVKPVYSPMKTRQVSEIPVWEA